MAEAVGKFVLILLAIAGVLAFAAGLSLLMAYPVKWTWNYVMPYEFALKSISWGQAWCLTFLSATLIKSSLSTPKSE